MPISSSRLAQRRALGGAVVVVAASAREADLAGVVGEVRGALREARPWARGVVHDQQQHRGGLERLARSLVLLLEVVGGEELARAAAGRARRSTMSVAHRAQVHRACKARYDATAMILYDYFRSSAAYRVRIALNLKGLEAERRFVHLRKGEQRDAGLPRGESAGPRAARWWSDDRRLTQSLAIIEYLDEKHPRPAAAARAAPRTAPGCARSRSRSPATSIRSTTCACSSTSASALAIEEPRARRVVPPLGARGLRRDRGAARRARDRHLLLRRRPPRSPTSASCPRSPTPAASRSTSRPTRASAPSTPPACALPRLRRRRARRTSPTPNNGVRPPNSLEPFCWNLPAAGQ